MGELQGQIPVYAHHHPCEGRWHAFATVTFQRTPTEEPQKAHFHDWDKHGPREAAAKVSELVELFLHQNGVPNVTFALGQPAAVKSE